MIVLATLVLYLFVAPPFIVDGDNAEFSTLGTVGGVAHPPGYPLYVLYLRALSWLPGTSPAHTAAIATVLITVAQVFVLHAASRAWGARPLAASVAVAIFAAGPVVLRVQSEAEVFALNGLVVALVLWLAAKQGPVSGLWRAGLLGLVAGLGLANHTTCVLVAPIGILGVVRGMRETGTPVRAALLAVAGLLVGLLPYLYLFIAPATRISWAQIDGVGELVHHMLRYDFGGPGAFARSGAEPEYGANVVALAATLARGLLWLPLAIGLGMLGLAIAKPRAGETRWMWIMLAVGFVIAGPLLVMRFNLPPRNLTLHMCQRFHLLPLALLVIPVAVGLDQLASKLRVRVRPVVAVFPIIGFFVAAATSLPHIAETHTPAVEQSVRNMLRSVPDGAVVIVASDDGYYGSGYVQDALRERRDVVVISWTLMSLDDYRARVEERSGVAIDPRRHSSLASVAFAEQALARGRAVFVDGMISGVLRELPTYPHGILFRVLPRGSALPPIAEVFAINKALFEKFQFGYPIPTADLTLYSTYVHSEYARTWAIIAKALAAAGNRDDYAYALDMARAIGPQSP